MIRRTLSEAHTMERRRTPRWEKSRRDFIEEERLEAHRMPTAELAVRKWAVDSAIRARGISDTELEEMINEVIFGCEMTDDHRESLMRVIDSWDHNPVLYQARRHDDRFELVLEEVE